MVSQQKFHADTTWFAPKFEWLWQWQVTNMLLTSLFKWSKQCWNSISQSPSFEWQIYLLSFPGFMSAAFENYRSGWCSELERESRQLLNTCCTLAKTNLICYVLLRTYFEPSSSEGILITETVRAPMHGSQQGHENYNALNIRDVLTNWTAIGFTRKACSMYLLY